MINSSTNTKNSLLILIGIPVLFLVLNSFIKTNDTYADVGSEIEYNRYVKLLPNKYANLISDKMMQNDSTFSYSILEEFGIRELVIFKSYPNYSETNSDFNINLKLEGKEDIKLDISNNAGLFNYNGMSFGVFKKSLPFIDIAEIDIKQIVTNKNHIPWEAIISEPFKLTLEELSVNQVEDKSEEINLNTYLSTFAQTLRLYDIAFAPYNYAVKDDALFQTNFELESYTLSNKETIGSIEKADNFWKHINSKEDAALNFIKFQGENSNKANGLIENYLKGDLIFEETFDIQKMAYFFAIRNLFSNSCKETIHVIYNSNSNLIEPFFIDSKCLGEIPRSIIKPSIENLAYTEAYIQALNEVANMDVYEKVIKSNESFEEELSFINKYDPQNIFSYDVIEINQRIINKSLDPTALVIPRIVSFENQRMELIIDNQSIFPINILSLNYNPTKEITQFNFPNQIKGKSKDTLIIQLPRSFENLFVSKKSKTTGFNLYEHIYDLNISYSTSNINQVHYTSITPFQETYSIEDDLFRIKSNIELNKDTYVNKQNNTITFNKQKVTIDAPLIVPSGYMFVVKAGTQVDIVKGGKIISNAPVKFLGTKEKPISVFSSDKKGQGIIVLGEGQQSDLYYTDFNDLTNLKHGYWNVTGAVTFYESPVNLKNVSIRNNRCEDALNIVRTHFTMKDCEISNTQSDAFDGDFVKGTIVNCTFDNLGNDAIDISGSDLTINKVVISAAGDKGLSAGEDSKMTIDDVSISNSEIAVAGKDLSIINAKNIKITSTKLGFTAFQKKPEFGPSNVTINGLIMENVETDYLIESSSSLLVDGVKIETAQNVKDRMYGVEFGRSSAETRNSQ